jgi:hypothetical protein
VFVVGLYEEVAGYAPPAPGECLGTVLEVLHGWFAARFCHVSVIDYSV